MKHKTSLFSLLAMLTLLFGIQQPLAAEKNAEKKNRHESHHKKANIKQLAKVKQGSITMADVQLASLPSVPCLKCGENKVVSVLITVKSEVAARVSVEYSVCDKKSSKVMVQSNKLFNKESLVYLNNLPKDSKVTFRVLYELQTTPGVVRNTSKSTFVPCDVAPYQNPPTPVLPTEGNGSNLHPLTELSATEIDQALAVANTLPGLGFGIATAVLRTEPDKYRVLSGDTTIPRLATVIFATQTAIIQVYVNLETQQIVASSSVATSNFLPADETAVKAAMLGNAQIVEQLTCLGIDVNDPDVVSQLFVAVIQATGVRTRYNLPCCDYAFAPEDNDPLAVGMFYIRDSYNIANLEPFVLPRVSALVEQGTYKVLRVLVEGVCSLPDVTLNTFYPAPLVKEIDCFQGQQGVTVDPVTNEVTWKNWKFQVVVDPLTSVNLYQVQFKYPSNAPYRSILYKVSNTDIIVPYGTAWGTFTPFNDMSSTSALYSIGEVIPGLDAPPESIFIPATFQVAFQGQRTVTRAVAVYLEDDDVVYRMMKANYHTLYPCPFDPTKTETGGRLKVLVVRWILNAGGYDYINSIYFHQDGSINISCLAQGIIHTGPTNYNFHSSDPLYTGNKCSKKEVEVTYASPVSPISYGFNHQHNVVWRLDFDVDGVENRVVEENINRFPTDCEANPCAYQFPAIENVLEHETSRPFALDRSWTVQGTTINPISDHRTGYSIEPGRTTKLVSSLESPTAQRFGFINCPIHFTRYRADEQYGGGYNPSALLLDKGVGTYVANKEDIVDKDVVVWYTMGFAHHTRTEDWPVMSAEKLDVSLKPENFFPQNPAYETPYPCE